jgi:hypothetical protein
MVGQSPTLQLMTLTEKIRYITAISQAILENPEKAVDQAMPSGTYVLDNNMLLVLPGSRGDSRYPYGKNGYNFWAYASGYMYCNDGLFSVFMRAPGGQEPKAAFFAGFPDKSGQFTPVPLLRVPRMVQSESLNISRYTIFSPSAAYYITQMPLLTFALRIFVTDLRDICFSLHVENFSETACQFFLSSFLNPYLRHRLYESDEDPWFREGRLLAPAADQGELGSFLLKVSEDISRTSSVSHFGIIRRWITLDSNSRLTAHEETTSRCHYVGSAHSSLHTPGSLFVGTFTDSRPVCAFTEVAIAGDILHLFLGSGQKIRLDIVLSCTDNPENALNLAYQPLHPDTLDSWSDCLEQDDHARHCSLSLNVGSADTRLSAKVFNSFFEHLKRQVEFCSLIKGYVQLAENSLIGIRDVFQALEGLMFWHPDAARLKMLEALNYMTPEGRCFRQYSLAVEKGNVGRMDLRPFIDQGVWVISAVATYLRLTGDWSFLEEICGYHEILDETAGKVILSEQKDTVLDHLLKIMDYLLSNRDQGHTGCIFALYGDWNDALDGLGVSESPSRKYGTGVSITASLQVYRNVYEIIEILNNYDAKTYAEDMSRYHKAGLELNAALRQFAVAVSEEGEKRILHGWGDQRKYLVGSFKVPDGQPRDSLTPYAFWVLSGMYDQTPKLRADILSAFERLDSTYGFKTFEPFFPEDMTGVGRIVKLPPGTAENAATYVHATAFAVMALFRMGCPEKAWEQLIKILPFTDVHGILSHSPFVMPNSYCLNKEKFIDGESMNDWQTGASNVVLKLLVRYVLGVEPRMQGLWIQPAGYFPFKSFEFSIRIRSCNLCILYQNDQKGRRMFTVRGTEHRGQFDEIMGTRKLWIPYDALADGLTVHVTD